MISSFLTLLNPYRWLAYIAGITAVVGLFWYAVHSYNVSITKEAVATALADERAAVKPAFDDLEATIKTRDLTIATMLATSDSERTKRQALINVKTIELKNALQANKILSDKNAKLLGDSTEFDRLLKSIETRNNDSTDAASGSSRFKQQSAAYQQCERDFRSLAETTAETSRRLSEADAIIKALKQ
jgi:hypothetical protein